ncbi:DUF1549 and DUF1553 domain-containing protein [Tundrisphaera lichenicola]|uniref:DUF1549 and DUF1553 domain-containing protein n=1 Tax=Tundrisphaera lichenicola TaxID=2029860 RepID=UPI003EB7B3BC
MPADSKMLAGDPGVQMIADQPREHGGSRDLTSSVSWKVEPLGVVEIDSGGYLRPIGPGKARIVATSGSSTAEATVEVGDAPRSWSFAQDITPILTRSGCNTGGCHGRADGQNGFHLSFFGYDPEGDYRSLTRDVGERRLSTIRPESSLFLAKATGRIPHAGGPRIRVGSEEYRTLMAWMKAGVPDATPKNHGKLDRITVEPGDVRLEEPGPQQLRVVAHYSDGHDRDVTRLANYKVNDDSVIDVDDKGLAKLLRRGEADLVVRYGSEVVSARMATLINPDLKYDFAGRTRRNFIDDELFKRLESLQVPPSPPSSDATFLRRVTLDLTGEQPSPDQVREFLKDTSPEKRIKLVDNLIASRDFSRFWQIKLGDLLEITTARPELGNAAYSYQTWVSQKLLENAPWDAMVRELLTTLGDPADRETSGAVAYALEGLDPKVSAEKTAQRFLGLRIRCAQCHDHPFDVWTQDDYFGLAATFAKVQRSGGDGPGMMNRSVVKIEPKGQVEHLRTHKPAVARLLTGEPIKVAETEDPRVKLAEWMTSPENPYFARAMANWVWAQFFGKGIADPPDDLSRSNPPVHPELLDSLASHFVKQKFDLRDLIRTVAISEAYAMASTTLPGNQEDHRLFSHQTPRPLTAHQMADALALATEVTNRFQNKPNGTRAIEITDPSTRSDILDTFGRCNRINGCASVANPALSLRQSLLLIGGDVIEGKVTNPRGYLANLLELSPAPDEIVENLYLRALCRPPTSEETTHWSAELSQSSSMKEAAEDLFWALLNSREFAFNH